MPVLTRSCQRLDPNFSGRGFSPLDVISDDDQVFEQGCGVTVDGHMSVPECRIKDMKHRMIYTRRKEKCGLAGLWAVFLNSEAGELSGTNIIQA